MKDLGFILLMKRRELNEETGVKDFSGTGEVMFVAERPSTRRGKVPDNLDIEFFKLLRKFNL